MRVFLADVDEADLEAAAKEVGALARQPTDVVAVPTDVSDPLALERLRDVAFAKGGGAVNFLMNNAGIGIGGGALAPAREWQRTIAVNMWGPIHGCQVFVPAMQASGEPGIVVNTGSKQGITRPPGNLAYNVSKAAVVAYTEGLEHELRAASGRQISVHLLVPGFVNTSIFLKTKRAQDMEAGRPFDPASVPFHEGKPIPAGWLPDQVVDFMFEELEKERFYLICPDNEVDRETDNLRMTWTMQDITENRPPLSRWHPDYKEAFEVYMKANRKKSAL
eukprot:gnl/TRDRNA2_/TRDRNA2_34289_c0_seq1.p1 gnl/TRDRNA2_/TRDRNA2_34289_c0~~gnl/TRDRNA2_/TRDRNA2_34289_c0_seq1.p1  ORF type:complete len:308 (+),score=63.41 gnl/TRDRNA2_/TRDRNA2_34289_c0_seq1:94-924(+)